MKKWSLITKLWVLCCFFLTNILVVGLMGLWNSRQMVGELDNLSNIQIPAVRAMTLVDMYHDSLRGVAYHSIILSGTKEKKEIDELKKDFSEAKENISKNLKIVEELPLGEEVKKAVGEATGKIASYIEKTQAVVESSITGKTEAAIGKMEDFDKAFEDLEKKLSDLGGKIMEGAKAEQAQAQVLSHRANLIGAILVLSGLALGLLGAVGVIVTMRKELTGVVQEMSLESTHLNSMAENLRGAAGELKDSVAQQASALQETASSVEEISAMLKKTNESSKTLESSAAESQRSIESGQEAVAKMLTSMNDIHKSNANVVNQVEASNKQITEIVKVISEIENKTKVINDIVFQTKLLSFNASVEAARAGEHGKGFAVVAEEVGNLAQMSGNAAKEISDMLSGSIKKVETIVNESRARIDSLAKESRQKTEEGTKVAEVCGKSLDQIVKHTSHVNMIGSEISIAIREQTLGVEEVSKAMNLLSQTTQTISSVSENTLSSADTLLTNSGALRQTIGRLRSMAVGEGTAPVTKSSNVIPLRSASTEANSSEPKMAEPKKIASGDHESLPRHDDPRFEDV